MHLPQVWTYGTHILRHSPMKYVQVMCIGGCLHEAQSLVLQIANEDLEINFCFIIYLFIENI